MEFTIAICSVMCALVIGAIYSKFLGMHKLYLLMDSTVLVLAPGALWFNKVDYVYLDVLVCVLVCISYLLLILGFLIKQKIYSTYLDVPRQVLYVEDDNGTCTLVSTEQAKKEVALGHNVYIHAIARVKYIPKDIK